MPAASKEIKALHAVLQDVLRIDPFMTVTRLDALLTFAVDGDITTIQDLTDVLSRKGISKSAISRNLSYWTDEQWKRMDGTRPIGEDFIELRNDPVDLRRKKMDLTGRGSNWLDQLSERMRNALEE